MLRLWHGPHSKRSAQSDMVDSRRRAEIRPTDNDESHLPIVGVTQGNYGSVEILTDADGINILRYTGDVFWIGSDFLTTPFAGQMEWS